MMSVGYRFFLAGLLLLGYCRLRNIPLSFTVKEHAFIAIQGLLLFSTSYWLVYVSEIYLTSGLVAVGFSTLIFFNIFLAAIFLEQSVSSLVVLGALFGLMGTAIIYKPELNALSFSDDSFKGLVYCFLGVLFASSGNVMSAFNQQRKLPVIQTNAFGMFYGAIYMLILGIISGKSCVFDVSFSYVVSLFYLTIFGSIIAFTSYLTLIGRVGAGKGAYAILSVPVVAIFLSVFFEEYAFTWYSVTGISLIIGGNMMALKK